MGTNPQEWRPFVEDHCLNPIQVKHLLFWDSPYIKSKAI